MDGFSFSPTNVDVMEPVSQAVALYDSWAKTKGIQIKVEGEYATLSVFADPDHLELILRNLLSNAIKFSPPKSVIQLSIQPENDRILFTVKDEGPGMPEKIWQSIRLDKITPSAKGTKSERGTGLGLALIFRLLALQQSELQLKTKPGTGTIFSFELPSGHKTANS